MKVEVTLFGGGVGHLKLSEWHLAPDATPPEALRRIAEFLDSNPSNASNIDVRIEEAAS